MNRDGSTRGAGRLTEPEGLSELERVRAPLFEELERLSRASSAPAGRDHLCCKREQNQMRISPLEARAIALAFRENPRLRRKLPAVLERLDAELPGLEDSSRRQRFECPLLEGTRCLVHFDAKPIGCLAWNRGRDYSTAGWKAFARRDELNDRVCGPRWKLRVIPLWLKRAFAAERAAPPV